MSPRVVVVTGASAGVGRAVVRMFAAKGDDIALIARGKEGLDGAREEVERAGGKSLVLPLDVAHAEAVEDAASEIEERLGPIDVWVNNAMTAVLGMVVDTSAEEFRRVIEVTYLGYVHGTLAALSRMRRRDRGVIIQVGSGLAYRAIPLQASYCAAKFAVRGFTDSLRSELRHEGSNVRLTMVQLPGLNTPQFEWVHTTLSRHPRPVPPVYQPEVAARAIAWAAKHPRRELWVGAFTPLMIWADRVAPGLVDRYLARTNITAQQLDRPIDPHRESSLWKPIEGDRGAHGILDDEARGTSIQLWLATHRPSLTVLTRTKRGEAKRSGRPRKRSPSSGRDRREPIARRSAFAGGGSDEPGRQMVEHHHMARWVQPVLMVIAAWLASSPFTFGYRSTPLAVSDLATAGVLVTLAWISFKGGAWAGWMIGGVGIWLLLAPLVFSAPTAAAMANDTLVGSLVIGFGILVPHGMAMEGPEIPPGWSYNPSTWTQRAPIIALGLLGFVISRYLAAFQLGHIEGVWEPFFGTGTERILTSEVSKMFPVSDAGLGAVAYALEVLMGLMGDHRRWRTMPWMVAGFGILVIPLGAAQIILIMLQPIAVGTWCTLCLISAAGMLLMITVTIDEVVAMGQLLAAQRRRGVALWHAFWYGANLDGEDHPGPARRQTSRPSAAIWGSSSPWNLIAVTAIGVWLLVAPSVFGTIGLGADSDHLVGALVVTSTVIALAEPVRALRYANLPLGLWLVLSALLLRVPSSARASDIVAGVAICALSLRRGPMRDRYGTWEAWTR